MYERALGVARHREDGVPVVLEHFQPGLYVGRCVLAGFRRDTQVHT